MPTRWAASDAISIAQVLPACPGLLGECMSELTLPVRFYGSDHAILTLDLKTIAIMVVDANVAPAHPVVTDNIAPVLHQARALGIRVFYFHEDGYGTGGPADITR